MSSEKQMTRCASCGGTEFELLMSGKYKCKHCGSQQLPSAIQTYVVDAKTPFFEGNIFKKYPKTLIAGGVGFAFLVYSLISFINARSALSDLTNAYNEVMLQRQRTTDILQRNKIVLDQQYQIVFEKIPLEKIIAKLTIANDSVSQRILDELSGGYNREVVALRRYKKAQEEWRGQRNWLTAWMGGKYILKDAQDNRELIQRK
ncbi:MAG TPA: hypothetical protein PLY93_01910 [Turneriella sp.]|nr:hypothetical protein [Turneriella sp.]